jgi:serine protease Do
MKNKRFSIGNSVSAIFLSLVAATALPSLAGFASASAAPVGQAVAGLPDIADLVERAGPAVVNIRTTEKMRTRGGAAAGGEDEEMQEFFRRFFGSPMPRSSEPPPNTPNTPQQPPQGPTPEEEVQRGVGSGFIISADGYVMTNAHVVEGADEVYVTLTDKREFKAKVIGADVQTDVGC